MPQSYIPGIVLSFSYCTSILFVFQGFSYALAICIKSLSFFGNLCINFRLHIYYICCILNTITRKQHLSGNSSSK